MTNCWPSRSESHCPISARDDVGRTARRKADNDAHRSRRIGSAPKRRVRRPAARQHPPPDAENVRRGSFMKPLPERFFSRRLATRHARREDLLAPVWDVSSWPKADLPRDGGHSLSLSLGHFAQQSGGTVVQQRRAEGSRRRRFALSLPGSGRRAGRRPDRYRMKSDALRLGAFTAMKKSATASPSRSPSTQTALKRSSPAVLENFVPLPMKVKA